jgi:hydroxymethylpyrimidine pyrophosphatase-like HAD family hydrolase
MNNRRIIAVDFDGTIVEDEWPNIGSIKNKVIDAMQREKDIRDTYIIIWTCRSGEELQKMQDFLDKNNIPYDRINANAPWILDEWKRDNRKIFAHEYWDDNARRIE